MHSQHTLMHNHQRHSVLVILATLAMVWLAVVLALFISFRSTVATFIDNSTAQLLQSVSFFSNNQSELVNAKLNELERTLMVLSSVIESDQVGDAEIRDLLLLQVSVSPEIADFLLLDTTGSITLWTQDDTEPRPSVADRDYFLAHLNAQAGDHTFLSSPSLSRIEDSRPFVAMSKPIIRDGVFDGVLALAIDLERFSNALGGVTQMEGVTTVLADLDGRLIMRRPFIELQESITLDSLSQFRGKPPEHAHFLIESPFDGAQRRVSFHRLPDWPWVAFVGAELAPVLAANTAFVQTERLRLVFSLLIISLMILVISWLTWLRKRSEQALIEDIRERKSVEKQLAWQAHHDSLTRLPNRMLFYDRLHQALQRHERYRQPFSLIYLDLDGFKQVNDQWGHAAGDELLQAVAQRLIEHTRTSDTVARLAGDEFVILAEQCDRQKAFHLASKVLGSLDQPISLSEHSLKISASFGIASAPEDGIDADDLIRTADAAMYSAKKAGKSRVEAGTDLLD